MNLAHIGWDLQTLLAGRAILGLGSQIKPHIEKRFSMPWSRPAARMREMVLAIRAIWADVAGRHAAAVRGRDLPPHADDAVLHSGAEPVRHRRGSSSPASGPAMTEVAGEVADGFLVHPFSTAEFLREHTLPALERGLATSGAHPRRTSRSRGR